MDALEAKYATDLEALKTADTANEAAINALGDKHKEELAALTEKADATKAELDELTATYNTAVAEINSKIAANEKAISDAKTELQNKLDILASDHDSEIATINGMITDLQTASEARFAELERQVAALLSAHKHTFGTDWVDYSGNANVYCENRLFYRICLTCNVLEWKQGSAADHDFETVTTPPTCHAVGYDTNTCTTCGKVEITNLTEKVSHIYKTTYSHDGSYHWYDCQHCDATEGRVEHTVDTKTGYCTICNRAITGGEGIMYDLSADGTTAAVIGYEGTTSQIIIADTYAGKPVIAICKEAFCDNDTIVSVFVPASIVEIGYCAFERCSNLASVTFGENSQLTSIGSSAFEGCGSLTSITIPASVTRIGGSAFRDCTGLTSIVIPNKVTHIYEQTFEGCTGLKSIVIPNSVTSIGSYAFGNCKGLTSIVIPDSVTSIAEFVFYDCTGILQKENGVSYVDKWAVDSDQNVTSVHLRANTVGIAACAFAWKDHLVSFTIPDSVISIGAQAFDDCNSLKSITIPASVTSIGEYAFYDCSNLGSVYYKGTANEWSGIDLGYNNGSLTSATRYYYSAEQPTATGNYWRWVDGVPTPW